MQITFVLKAIIMTMGAISSVKQMSLNKIQYFKEVVERESFSEAAKHLDVQPSSVSRQIAVLEQELGVLLFKRTTRKCRVTPAGKIYYQHILKVFLELQEANNALLNLHENMTGMVRLSVTSAFSTYQIIPLLKEFHTLYPDIDIDLVSDDSVVDLADSQVDVCIRIGVLPDSNLIARKLWKTQFYLYASQTYLSKFGSPLNLEDLLNYNCLQYSQPGWNHWMVYNQRNSKLEKIECQGFLQVNNVPNLVGSVKQGIGLALLPDWSIDESSQLVKLLPQYKFSANKFGETDIHLLYLQKKYLSPRVKAVVDFFYERMKRSH